MAAPSLLSLRSPWFWLAVGFLSTPDGLQWWLAVVVVAASWAMPSMRRVSAAGSTSGSATATEPLHPLGESGSLWQRRADERPV